MIEWLVTWSRDISSAWKFNIEIMPVSDTVIYRVELSENTIESITKIDAITRQIIEEISSFFLFPAKHFITDPSQLERAVKGIKEELKERLDEFKKKAKFWKHERLKRRTKL
jgi:excinuclease ABC subunit B